jgi:hypothetical protein
MIPWLQDKRDQHFSNECRAAAQFLRFHHTTATRPSPKDQWVHELIIKYTGLWKLLSVIRIADNLQLVIGEQGSLRIENRQIHSLVGFIYGNSGNFSDQI